MAAMDRWAVAGDWYRVGAEKRFTDRICEGDRGEAVLGDENLGEGVLA
jgi:hypothetical protein